MSPKTKRTIRTVIQTAVALAAGLPLIIAASGVSATAGGVVIALAVAGAVTRVMALPVVEGLLARVGLGFPTPPYATEIVPAAAPAGESSPTEV